MTVAGRRIAVSVVIPTHNRRALLLRAIDSLSRQTFPATSSEVCVVCDGSTDGTAPAARERAEELAMPLVVIEQSRSGAATARNTGAAATSAPVILFLDDDMIADRQLLEAHARRHAAEPGGIVLGAMPVDPASPRSFVTVGLNRWVERRHGRLSDPSRAVPFEEVITGNLSVAREAFEAVGRFDVRFTAGGSYGGEDVEFGLRAAASGIPILYEPRAIARQLYDKRFLDLCRNVRHSAAADALMAVAHPDRRSELPLGRVDSWPPWERRALALTLRRPVVARALLGTISRLLDALARAGATGERLEHLAAVCRAHAYGLGLLDAEFPALAARSTR